MATAVVVISLIFVWVHKRSRAEGELDALVAFTRLYGVVRYFYPADVTTEIDWNGYAVYGVSSLLAHSDDRELAVQLRMLFGDIGRYIEVTSGAISTSVKSGSPASEPTVRWQHRGYGLTTLDGDSPYLSTRTNRPSLGSNSISAKDRRADSVDFAIGKGLNARVPLVLSDAAAKEHATLAVLNERISKALRGTSGDAADRSARIADIVVAWNVYRHFYPYLLDDDRAWDAALKPLLRQAMLNTSREQQRRTLESLVSLTKDGHGRVSDISKVVRLGHLPITFEPLPGGALVVSASDVASVRVGDLLAEVDGIDASLWFNNAFRFTSGSAQWRAWRVAKQISEGEAGNVVALSLKRGEAQVVRVDLEYMLSIRPPGDHRPEVVQLLGDGIWYIDLERVTESALNSNMSALADASTLIIDVRGYPSETGVDVLRHLLRESERSRWMHIPIYDGPFGKPASYADYGWDLTPKSPAFDGNALFLTDGRTMSYGESIVGYARGAQLGTIVGSSTAGINGDVCRFRVPSGFDIYFTGMLVTKHDGTPMFMNGFSPDVSVSPTVASIRAKRDDVLDRALDLARNGKVATRR